MARLQPHESVAFTAAPSLKIQSPQSTASEVRPVRAPSPAEAHLTASAPSPRPERIPPSESRSEAPTEAGASNPGELTPIQDVSLEAVAADPMNRPLIQEFLGRASATPEGAIEIEKFKALAIEIDNSVPAEELADYFKSLGENEEAVDWYQRALDKNPPNPEEIRAMIGLSQQILNRGRDQQGQM